MTSVDGLGRVAEFCSPCGVALDNAGNVYVADTVNCTIRKIRAAGEVTTLAGRAGVAGNVDGLGGEARFNNPTGVAMDSAGNLYVADSENLRISKGTPYKCHLNRQRWALDGAMGIPCSCLRG